MELTSYYRIECLCGRQIETRKTELVCSNCNRQLVIEWQPKVEAAKVVMLAKRSAA